MDRKRILLADDEPDLLEPLRFCLEHEGHEVFTATDGENALEIARRVEPDLVVLDVMMPKENGYRVSQAIREDEDSGKLSKQTSIVLLTGRNLAAEPDREKMFMKFSRADAMMYKPYDLDDLIERIQEILDAQ